MNSEDFARWSEGRDQEIERLSIELKRQVRHAKQRISDRYADPAEVRSFLSSVRSPKKS
jgi:hypothetical protein